MNTAVQTNDVPIAQWYRGFGRASAVVLFVAWLGLLVTEMAVNKFGEPPIDVFLQGAALAFVFAGYAIGWRHELLGGAMAILGTVAFFVVALVAMSSLIGLWPGVLFAVPGVLYILAWCCDKNRDKHLWRLV